jgi:Phasin protein
MTQKQSWSPNYSMFDLAPADLATEAKKRMEEFVSAQTELFDIFQESNRQWVGRIQAEATLASELTSKLTAARSIPDAMSACQEWGSRRFEMMAEDTKHLLDDSQKFMQAGAHLLMDGLQSQSFGVSK